MGGTLTEACLAGVTPAHPAKPTVVVLGARSESRLHILECRFLAYGIPHVAIREPDPPYNGALMAIGVAPLEKELVFDLVKDYNLLRFDTPEECV
jgi:hypothetical protein